MEAVPSGFPAEDHGRLPGGRGRGSRGPRLPLVAALLLCLFPCGGTWARELYRGDAVTVDVGATYKNLFLGNRSYEIPGIEDRTEASDYQRARLMLDLDVAKRVALQAHYQHWSFLNPPETALVAAGVLAVADKGSLYRLTALDWGVEETDDFRWRYGFDRLSVSAALSRVDLVVGRQAITWGTGRFWQPTDLFSPFGPLQVDREFKAGTDAVRVSCALGDFTHAEAVWAFGEDADLDRSAGVGKFQTLLRDYEVSVLGGWVKTDYVVGMDFAGDLGRTGIGLHGEGLWNHVRESRGSDYVQFLVGLDYRFPGKGPYLLGEYYYNGAGAKDPSDLNRAAQDPRILSRGTYHLGRHYLGLGALYEILPILTETFNVLVDLGDPSAILNPTLAYSISDNATATLGATIPLGEAPTFFVSPLVGGIRDVRLESEFGTYPLTVFLEVKFYVQ